MDQTRPDVIPSSARGGALNKSPKLRHGGAGPMMAQEASDPTRAQIKYQFAESIHTKSVTSAQVA